MSIDSLGRLRPSRVNLRIRATHFGRLQAHKDLSTLVCLQRQTMRETFRTARRTMGASERRRADHDAQEFVIGHSRFKRAKRIALYRPFDGETSTTLIAEAAQRVGKLVLYPRMEKHFRLSFVAPTSWATQRAGLPQPLGEPQTLEAADVLMVPGIVFDHHGHRLGFGQGYYDRALEREVAWPLGLCYQCQVIDLLEHEAWDRPVSALATEAGLTEIDPTEKLNV